jgi:hypothetical protein
VIDSGLRSDQQRWKSMAIPHGRELCTWRWLCEPTRVCVAGWAFSTGARGHGSGVWHMGLRASWEESSRISIGLFRVLRLIGTWFSWSTETTSALWSSLRTVTLQITNSDLPLNLEPAVCMQIAGNNLYEPQQMAVEAIPRLGWFKVRVVLACAHRWLYGL